MGRGYPILSCPRTGRSTPSCLVPEWGGVPHPVLFEMEVPDPLLDWGVPHPLLNGGGEVPPEDTWDQWKYYGMEMGYHTGRPCDQSKYYGMEMGYPSPTTGCGLTHKLKIFPSRILLMRAVINLCYQWNSVVVFFLLVCKLHYLHGYWFMSDGCRNHF